MTNSIAKQADAAFAQAVAMHRAGQVAQARLFYEKTVRLQPKYFNALYLLAGIALHENQPRLALEFSMKAIAVEPRSAAAHFNQGMAQMLLKQYAKAADSFAQALRLGQASADLFFQYADALCRLGRHDESLAAYDRVIALQPGVADAHMGRVEPLYRLHRLDEALQSCDRVISLNPERAPGHNARGNVLSAMTRFDAALESYDRAIALDAGYADAWYNRGNALRDMANYAGAIESYDRALRLDPDNRLIRGLRQYARMQICDWRDFERDTAEIHARLRSGQETVNPFFLLAHVGSPELLFKSARLWGEDESQVAAPAAAPSVAGPRIRVGYFSADFHSHATMYLLAGVLESHDRDALEVSLFSYGPDIEDEHRVRACAACDRFIEVRGSSDAEVARLARTLQLDIAVDLKGFTQHGRPGVFAHRAAPIQVSYLGYPGTLGASYMDYLVADAVVVDDAARGHYQERLIRLSPCYQPNDDTRPLSAHHFTRAEAGLPDSGFVFCCFNNNYKITPALFDVWMRILSAVDGSVLWLLEDNRTAADNLHREAERRRIDPNRLIFAPRMPQPEHLARQRLADLFLDTLPCNAHTTASDALWAGLPVLTCQGESFAGRVAASLVRALDMPELAVHSIEDYETQAVRLACEPHRLDALRAGLGRHRLASSLFDTSRYTRQLEEAFRQVVARHRAGLPPADLEVGPVPTRNGSGA